MRRDKVIDPQGREIEFTYDDAGRVTEQSFITDGREVAFAYDPNGNRTAHDGPGGTPIATAQYDSAFLCGSSHSSPVLTKTAQRNACSNRVLSPVWNDAVDGLARSLRWKQGYEESRR